MLDKNSSATPFQIAYFHGTKADLQIGDFITVGFGTNYNPSILSKYNFITSTLDAAIWGAELALGEGKERIYIVEPTGPIEDDPDLTDKKFPGNPTQSFRTQFPLRVIAEVVHWKSHGEDQVLIMKNRLNKLRNEGVASDNVD